jgi:hypothetical protein
VDISGNDAPPFLRQRQKSHSGNSQPSSLQQKLFEIIPPLNPCCDDDSCESVENLITAKQAALISQPTCVPYL